MAAAQIQGKGNDGCTVEVPLRAIESYKNPILLNNSDLSGRINKSPADVRDVKPPSKPVRVLLAISVSKRLAARGKKQELQRILKQLFESIPEDVLLGLVTFDDTIESKLDFTRDRGSLIQAINQQLSREPERRTELFDVMLQIPAIFSHYEPGDSIVVLTDADLFDKSNVSEDKAAGLLRKSGIRFFFITGAYELPQNVVTPELTFIEELSEGTSGIIVSSDSHYFSEDVPLEGVKLVATSLAKINVVTLHTDEHCEQKAAKISLRIHGRPKVRLYYPKYVPSCCPGAD